MAYDLKAKISLDDAFTNPMKNILRAFERVESAMRDNERLWGEMGGAAQQAATQVSNFGTQTQNSVGNMSALNTQLDQAHQNLNNMADAGNDVDSNLSNAGTTGQTSAGKIGDAFKKAFGILAAIVAVDQIKDLAVSMVEAAGSAVAMEAQFSTVFGDMEGEAEKRLQAIGDESTILENRMKNSFTKIAAFAKTGGMDTADSLDLADRSMRAIADSAAFYDRSLEDTTESLQSFLKGNFENDAALGLSATETTRNSAAMDLYGKKFKELDEAQKQLTLLQMVEDANKVTGALGQASREADGWENVIGNVKQAWEDLKAVVGVPLLEMATESIVGLTAAMQKVDGEKLAAGLSKGVFYMQDTFGPLIGVVKDDLTKLWDVLNQDSAKDGLASAFDGIKTSMHWIADNWSGIKDGVVALTGAFVAYHAALKLILIYQTINKLMMLYHSGLLITTAQQWLLNSAMLANPIGLVAAAIGGLVGAGILLYQNWDTVRAKTEALWDKLGAFQGVATLVLGPIGFIIKAAVTMADQWDSTKSVWENVWNGIVSAAESSVNSVVDSINWLIETINKIPGVNVPIIPKVDWTGVESTQSSRMTDQMSYAEAVHGSHATGLASVPHDGYIAELHKGEPVLTAQQGDILRGMGVLKSRGNKPVIDGSALSGARTGSGRTITKKSTANTGISINSIQVIGHNKPTEEIASEIVDKIKVAISNGALAGVN